MTFDREAIRDKPSGLWLTDDSVPFNDSSGYSNNGSSTGVVANGLPVCANAKSTKSYILNDAARGKFPTKVFQQGAESKPFSLEGWARPVRKGVDMDYSQASLLNNPSYTGNITGWTLNSTNATLIVEDRDFFGKQIPVLHSNSLGNTQNYSPTINVDPTKTYRLRLWFQDTAYTDNYQTYVGLYVYDSTGTTLTGVDLVTPNTGSVASTGNTNPYFAYFTGVDKFPLNQWHYLEVYIFGVNTQPSNMAGLGYFPSFTHATSHMRLPSSAVTMKTRFLNWNNTTVARDLYVADWDLQEMTLASPGVWKPAKATSGSSQTILGNRFSPSLSFDSTVDGIGVDGTKIAFSTKYLTTGECRAEYDIQVDRAVHVIGVHSSEKNSLYVDGALVAETDISDVQKADTFASMTDGFLYSGKSNSADELMINGLALYQYALSPDSVSRHYQAGRRVVGSHSPVSHQGTVIDLAKDPDDILFERHWQTSADWKAAVLSGLSVDNDQLVPQIISDVSVPGTWTDSCDLYDGVNADPINSVNMLWDGEGAVVEASIDGITWETVTRGKNLVCIPVGFNPSGKELYVRITFPGGITDDTSFVDNLVVTGFKTGTVPNVGNFQVAYGPSAYVKEVREPIAMDDSWGTEFRNGSAVLTTVVGADVFQPQTIEVWFKMIDSTVDSRFVDIRISSDQTLALVAFQYSIPSIGGSKFTLYRNGTPNVYGANGVLPVIGQWEVWHLVSATPITTPININRLFSNATQYSANVQVGRVVLYEDALAAADITSIIASYTGVPTLSVDDASPVSVAQSPTAANIYAHDWAIEQSG